MPKSETASKKWRMLAVRVQMQDYERIRDTAGNLGVPVSDVLRRAIQIYFEAEKAGGIWVREGDNFTHLRFI